MKSSHKLDYLVAGFFALVVALIYLTNLHGNFWISGWDNLHPELNFAANIKRALFAGWQEYQGLGLPAGHGHAAELFRELLLWPISLITSPHLIRKLWIALMLFIGPVGVYALSSLLTGERGMIGEAQKKVFAIMGGLFYLLHPITVQIFYVPYEAFVAHYGFLPWMVYGVLRYLKDPTRRNLLFLFLIHLAGSVQFYIPTLFLVYLFVVFAITVAHLSGPARQSIKKGLALFGVIVVANVHWLLSFVYYTATHIGSQLDAYLNFMYSEDIYLKNHARGGLVDAIMGRGFLLDITDQTAGGQFGYLAGVWRDHLQSPLVVLVGLVLFAIVILGGTYLVKKRKHRVFVLLFVLLFSLVAIQTYPFNLFNDALRESLLFHQVFRNPFTKFANTLLMVESVLLVFGIGWAVELLGGFLSKEKRDRAFGLLCTVVFILIAVWTYPVWSGNLVSSKLKITIPDSYFALFDYFKNQEPGRIANLPQFTPSGWNNYRWGYGGSGFIWYGIEQPIVDRAFDVWQPKAENYYWELSQALYAQDLAQFESVLEKYQIGWILWDGSLGGTHPRIINDRALHELLLQSSKLALDAKFGDIEVYRVSLATRPEAFVFAVQNPPVVEVRYVWADRDEAYLDLGTYVEGEVGESGGSRVFYPFRSLFTGRSQEDREFVIGDAGEFFVFPWDIPSALEGGVLVVPPRAREEFEEIDEEDLAVSHVAAPEIFINGGTVLSEREIGTADSALQGEVAQAGVLELRVPKIRGYYSFEASAPEIQSMLEPKACDDFNRGQAQRDLIERETDVQVRFTSVDSSNCADLELAHLPHDRAYLVVIESAHHTGKPMLFWVQNHNTRRRDLETYLPQSGGEAVSYFVIPPKEDDGAGYTLHFDNISLGGIKSVNDIGSVSVYPFPYRFLTTMQIVKDNKQDGSENQERQNVRIVSVEHPNPSVYRVALESEPSDGPSETYLVLSQAYHRGWKAYRLRETCNVQRVTCLLARHLPFLFGDPIAGHVMVNNWENGWHIRTPGVEEDLEFIEGHGRTPGVDRVVIIFWPQYLEYLGFVVMVVYLLRHLR